MKKILFLLVAMLFCVSCFFGCNDKSVDPQVAEPSDQSAESPDQTVEPSDQSKKEYVFPEITNKSELSEDETKAILAVTDKAMRDNYGINDLSVYGTSVHKSPNGYTYAEYTLYILGHHTDESYYFSLTSDYEIHDVDLDSIGKYSRYLSVVTKEDFKRAHEAIYEQTKKYNEEPYYYLEIDEEGFLCLNTEIIVHFDVSEDPDSAGCGIDHDHLFFSERLCAKP